MAICNIREKGMPKLKHPKRTHSQDGASKNNKVRRNSVYIKKQRRSSLYVLRQNSNSMRANLKPQMTMKYIHDFNSKRSLEEISEQYSNSSVSEATPGDSINKFKLINKLLTGQHKIFQMKSNRSRANVGFLNMQSSDTASNLNHRYNYTHNLGKKCLTICLFLIFGTLSKVPTSFSK